MQVACLPRRSQVHSFPVQVFSIFILVLCLEPRTPRKNPKQAPNPSDRKALRKVVCALPTRTRRSGCTDHELSWLIADRFSIFLLALDKNATEKKVIY